ncbi:MAG: Tail-specific protease [Chlamydiia bacterium]|nr:Tail-specific protease [Chlamydiia bacterium]
MGKIFTRFLVIFLLSVTCNLEAIVAPPQLTSHDTYEKTEEMLKMHAKYKKVDKALISRAFKIFIDKIDPIKMYLLKNEVEKYLNPSDSFLSVATEDYEHENFTLFTNLYSTFLKAIERRNSLETSIFYKDLPKAVDYKAIEEMSHPKSIAEWKNKLRMVKSIQEEAISHLDAKKQEKQRAFILRKRLNREKELTCESNLERTRMVHVFFLKSIAEALDSHTTYFTPHEAKQFIVHIQQRLFGIGALLRDSMDGLSVEKIIKGGPAQKGKLLKKGDKIIAVNNESIIGMDLSEAVDLIRGPRRSKVILSIIRVADDVKQNFDVEIVRDEIVVEESRYSSHFEPYGDGVIAHLHLHSFYGDPTTASSKDLRKELLDIQKKHKLKGVILDLRDNGGGLLMEAINVASLFIDKGVVAAIRTSTGEVSRLRNLNDNKIWDGPLMVLINKGSASASEIVAQSLSDYGRAIVVGSASSYGKGSHQSGTFFDKTPDRVNPKGEYKVTGGVYYTVAGKSPQLHGVASDVVVPGIYAETEVGEKFSKYPLENDSIAPLFEDDLADIHPLYRFRVKKALQKNLQKQESVSKYLPTLKKSSQSRISKNKDYQNFLKALKDPSDKTYSEEFFTQEDLQLTESKNIMKEFILLHEK